MNLTTLIQVILTIICAISVICVNCHPTKPLNERSTELVFQNWLLADQQQEPNSNNNRRSGDNRSAQKRVRVKSIFQIDKFDPCPEGYISDKFGRCLNNLELDQAYHLKFVLGEVIKKFPKPLLDYGDYGEVEENVEEEAKPVQINIPLIEVGPTTTTFLKTTLPLSEVVDEDELKVSTTIVMETTTFETTTFPSTQTNEEDATETTTIPTTTTSEESTFSTTTIDDSTTTMQSTTEDISSTPTDE